MFRLGTGLLFVVDVSRIAGGYKRCHYPGGDKQQGVYRQEPAKRTHLLRIIAAWLVTVPLSGLMAALLYFTIRGMMLP